MRLPSIFTMYREHASSSASCANLILDVDLHRPLNGRANGYQSFMDSDFMKRAFDLAVLFVAHALLLPVWIIIWIVIPASIVLFDSRPVFYRQQRIGKGGKVFTVVKFRTMIPNAEGVTGSVWAGVDDPRLTRIGRVLRKTGLDELPQVLSILKGDMSFVGPRAERPDLHQLISQEIPEFEQRLAVKPGLTGFAQLNGDYDLSPPDKLRYDLDYIRNRSLRLDAWLIIRSALRTLGLGWDKRGNSEA